MSTVSKIKFYANWVEMQWKCIEKGEGSFFTGADATPLIYKLILNIKEV